MLIQPTEFTGLIRAIGFINTCAYAVAGLLKLQISLIAFIVALNEFNMGGLPGIACSPQEVLVY
ncbi:hypothetical protein D3C87_2014870 [compost metagenome]